jgi:hypothetical protein
VDKGIKVLSCKEIPSAESLTGGKRHKGARKVDVGGGSFGGSAFASGGGADSPGSQGGGGGGGGSSGGSGGGGMLMGGAGGDADADGSEGLPNGRHPSDHLPLYFELVLT